MFTKVALVLTGAIVALTTVNLTSSPWNQFKKDFLVLFCLFVFVLGILILFSSELLNLENSYSHVLHMFDFCFSFLFFFINYTSTKLQFYKMFPLFFYTNALMFKQSNLLLFFVYLNDRLFLLCASLFALPCILQVKTNVVHVVSLVCLLFLFCFFI